MATWALLAVPMSACFAPTPSTGLACGPDQACPSGLVCAVDGTCRTEVGEFDASVPDAPPPPDGPPPDAADPLFAGLVAHWPLDGTGADTVGAATLTLGDGHGFDAGIRGQALAQSGNFGGAMTPNLDLIDVNADFTLSVWAYRAPSIYDNDALFELTSLVVCKRDGPFVYEPYPWGGKFGFFMVPDDAAVDPLKTVDDSPIEPPALDTWFHVVVVRRGDVVAMRVNGIGTAAVDVTGLTFTTSDTFRLGIYASGYPWQGRLDEAAVWRRALTDDEIVRLYGDGLGLALP